MSVAGNRTEPFFLILQADNKQQGSWREARRVPDPQQRVSKHSGDLKDSLRGINLANGLKSRAGSGL